MLSARPVVAIDPRCFGRGRTLVSKVPASEPVTLQLSDDLKLFVTTFFAGFIFVSLFLA
jgi:hypothetical protein